jgi:hypothetical protein
MKTKQVKIRARMEAKIDANQENMNAKTDANLKEIIAEMKA